MPQKTIHRIGMMPNAAPSVAEATAIPTGILKASQATMIATAREVTAAFQAAHFRAPKVTNIVSSGRTPTIADSARLFATALVDGVNTSAGRELSAGICC